MWNAERMRELGERHAREESERRLEPLMATLVAEPVYEFHTLGLRLCGGANVRRYYRQFFEDYMSRIVGGERLGLWVDERAFVLESAIRVRAGGGTEVHRVLSVLYVESAGDAPSAGGWRLGGERIYAGEGVIRAMAGRMFEELEPVS